MFPSARPQKWAFASSDHHGRSLPAVAAIALHALAAAALLTAPASIRKDGTARQAPQSSLKIFVPEPPVPEEPQQVPPQQQPTTEPAPPPKPGAPSPPFLPKADGTTPTTGNIPPLSPTFATPALLTDRPSPASVPPTSATPRPSLPKPEAKAANMDAEAQAYRQKLWAHIARLRPAGIRLEGSSLISFRIDRNGQLLSLHLARSSGNAMLDRLALRTLSRAAPFPPPPPSLDDTQLDFAIPFSFH